MGNMESLDKIDFKKIDPMEMIKRIEEYPISILDAYNLSRKFVIPSYFIKAKKILMAGMGGSGAAADIVKELMTSQTDLVIDSIHNYNLPGWVGADSLVIISSFSGNTEESLAAFLEAQNRGAKIITITTGGKLMLLSDKYHSPVFQFQYNSQPRAAFPYMFVLLLSVFEKLGYLEFSIDRINEIVALLDELHTKYKPENSIFGNPAKISAEKFYNHIPVIYASEKLAAVAWRLKTQINENSKSFAFYEQFPELNHNAMQGYLAPKNMATIMMLESNFEIDRNTLRQNVTAEIIRKNKIPLERIRFVKAKDRISEIFCFAYFSDFVSFYLAVLNKVNPSNNEVVDHFKSRLT